MQVTRYYFALDTVAAGYVVDEAITLIPLPDRIYAQYRTKPKAVAWYGITHTVGTPLAIASAQIRNMYDIDRNSGAQLDVIGRIVVQPREFTGSVAMVPGWCATAVNSPAECGDDTAMCSALNVDQDSQMSDDLYRLAIKAKIIKNNSDATIDSILDGVNFLLPNADVLRVTDGEDMSFSIEFYGNITELERWALRNQSFVPKPQGVRFNGFLEGAGYVECGDPTLMCGDAYAECVGFTGV